MKNDLLDTDFTGNINQKLLSRVATMGTVYFVFAIIYFIQNFYSFVIYLQKVQSGYGSVFVKYRVQFIITLLILLLGVVAAYINAKAYQLIKQSIKQEDADLFNKGYYYHSITFVLFLIGMSSTILLGFMRLLMGGF